MRRQRGRAQDELLDLRREQVHAPQDDHVVGAAGHLLHPPHRPGRAGQQPGQVPCAVAHHGRRLLGQRGEHEFAPFPVGQNVTGERIDDLGVEVVLPDVQAVLGLDALLRHAGAHDLRQPVDVGGLDAGPGLDLGAHLVGPGFGAEDAVSQRARRRVHALAFHLVDDREHVGRRDHDDVGPEVADQGDLTLGHTAGHGHDGAAELLRAVVRAEAAGEQPVAVGVVQQVSRTPAGGSDGARHHRRPHVEVVPGVTDDGRATGRARGRVHPGDLVARHGEHAEGVVLAQVGLGREREAGEIGQLTAVLGMHAGGVERGSVVSHVVVGVTQRPAQPLQLERGQFVGRRGLDRLESVGRSRGRDGSPRCTCRRRIRLDRSLRKLRSRHGV